MAGHINLNTDISGGRVSSPKEVVMAELLSVILIIAGCAVLAAGAIALGMLLYILLRLMIELVIMF